MEKTPESVVLGFMERVRSGKEPEAASLYMAGIVQGYQCISGRETVIERTPENYTEHVYEFIAGFGQYDFEIQEFMCQGNKVYVRWKQDGKHLGPMLGYEPTGLPLSTIGSAVYLVENGLIAAYWIQTEKLGLLEQLQENAGVSVN